MIIYALFINPGEKIFTEHSFIFMLLKFLINVCLDFFNQ